MKKRIIIYFLPLLLLLSACGSSKDFTPDYASAVGVIFISSAQELANKDKIYANFSNRTYSFDLDAASVYYFQSGAEEYYAGDQNLTALTFSAAIDENTVGAAGTVAYKPEENAENFVSVYYLYRDETGVYFDASKPPAASCQLRDGFAFTGTEYPCSITFAAAEPTASFTIVCRGAGQTILEEKKYTPQEITDYQKFEMNDDVSSVQLLHFRSSGEMLYSETITPENPSSLICCDNGGLLLGSKMINFVW